MADKDVNYPVTRALATGYIKSIKNPDEGGFTHRHVMTGENPIDKNIMVSTAGFEQKVETSRLTPSLLVKYAKTHRGNLVGAGHYFGGYQMDPVPGRQREAALDVSVGVPFAGRNKEKLPLAEAMRLAAVYNQESVYDTRVNAATKFPRNPYYNKPVPADVGDKEAWTSRWLLERLS